MNKYAVFYNREQIEVDAETSLEASNKGVEYFQKKYPRRKIKPWQLAVIIGEKDGITVMHRTSEL